MIWITDTKINPNSSKIAVNLFGCHINKTMSSRVCGTGSHLTCVWNPAQVERMLPSEVW